MILSPTQSFVNIRADLDVIMRRFGVSLRVDFAMDVWSCLTSDVGMSLMWPSGGTIVLDNASLGGYFSHAEVHILIFELASWDV